MLVGFFLYAGFSILLDAFGCGGGFSASDALRLASHPLPQFLLLAWLSSYLSNFPREFGYRLTHCFWREALLPGFFQRALSDALRDYFATLEQFFAFFFRRFDELI